MTDPASTPVSVPPPLTEALTPSTSLWAPFALPVFRLFWIALFAENICSWLMDVSNGWVMSSLTDSPLMIALVQTGATLPVLLFGLVTGAVGDIVDRRKLLLWVEAALALSNGLIAAGSGFGWLTPPVLLACIFVNGTALAFGMASWQALPPFLVQGPALPSAFVMTGVAANLSRAVGPALAGALLSLGGPTVTFAMNAVGFLGIFLLLRQWPGVTSAQQLPAERVLAALVTGVRYVLFDRKLQVALIRCAAFMLFAAAFWAMTPIIGRRMLGMDAMVYGLWMAVFGLGAVLGGWLINRYRATVNVNTIIGVTTILTAVAMFALLQARYAFAFPGMFLMGGAWMVTTSSLLMGVHSNVASWVRGRAVAVYLMVFQGSLAIGAFGWGLVAEKWGPSTVLLAAAVGLVVAYLAVMRWRLAAGDAASLAPYGGLPVLTLATGDLAQRTPVRISVEYHIRLEDRVAFLAHMAKVALFRQRNGAADWSLLEDAGEAGRWMETFGAETLVENERQRERLTAGDYGVLEQAYALHQGGGASPLVTRWIGPASTTP